MSNYDDVLRVLSSNSNLANELLDMGAITQSEYEEKKNKLMGEI